MSKQRKFTIGKKVDDLTTLLGKMSVKKSRSTAKKLSKFVTNDNIDEIYNIAINSGALGGKLCGAGGGGFLLLYVPKNKQKNFFKYFNKFIHIPFNFENVGSKIIFKHNNK